MTLDFGMVVTVAPLTTAGEPHPEAQPGLDWRGATLVLLGLGGLIFGLIAVPISGWSDPIVLAALTRGPDSPHCVRVGRV